MDVNLGTLLSGATLAAVLWLFRSVQQLREDHVQLRTILTGDNGDNGIKSEVKGLRSRSHTHGDTLHAHAGSIALLDHRVQELEADQRDRLARDVGRPDRRSHT